MLFTLAVLALALALLAALALAARAEIEAIARTASAQGPLLDDLLDGRRAEGGELALDVRSVELVAVVEGALAGVRFAASARRVVVAAMLTPAVRPVAGDPGRLQQVVLTLLSNAVRSTPAGGRVEVRLEQEGGAAVIRVRDTGHGIAPASLPHVFDPPAPGAPPGGAPAGVGLAGVRRLVEAHGGTVSAESEGAGRGAAFTVRLPLAEPPPGPPRGACDARPRAAPSAEGRPGAG